MLKKHRFVPLALFVLLTTGAATNLTLNPVLAQQSDNQQSSKQQYKEMRDQVQAEVDHAFTHTTTLLNILLFIITLVPLAASAVFWSLRRSVISQIVADIKEQLQKEVRKQLQKEVAEELRRQAVQVKQEVDKQLEIDVSTELKKQTTASRQEIEKLTLELSQLFKLKQEVATDLKTQTTASKQKIEKLTNDFLSKILELQSDTEKEKNRIMQQLALLIPASIQSFAIPEPSVTEEEQKELRKLTSELESLRQGNPQLSFTTNEYLKQADALFLECRYEDAVKHYEQAIKSQPDCSLAWFSRGWALRRLGRYEEAVFSYDEGNKITSDDHLAWFGRGNALKKLNRYSEAITSYDIALSIQPKFDLIWYYRSRCYALQGKLDFALDDLEQAIKLRSQYKQSVKSEPDFDNVQDLERFKLLIAS